jgi:hypothetical protein
MSLERLMNLYFRKSVPARPSEISAPRWAGMVKMAETRYRERVKSFLKKW